MSKHTITVNVNGEDVTREVDGRTLLVHFIREDLSLTGTHIGCDTTSCGACTVHLDGRAVKSCTIFAVQADGQSVEESGGFDKSTPGRVQPMLVNVPDNASLMVVASKSHRDQATDDYIAKYDVKDMTSAGSSLKFCLVAAGEADLYPRLGRTMEWDTAAGHAILRAAGGLTIHPDGSVFRYGKAGFRNSYFIASGQSDRWEPKASV